MKRAVLFASLIFLLLFAVNMLAQSTADLHVAVKDPKGAAVTNASVVVRDPSRGFERTVTQNESGQYPVLRLQPGNYTVTVEAAGFAKTTVPSINVTVGQIAELPITLRIAERAEAIEVSAQTEQVETQQTAVATTITEQRIDNLPINGRNYINFTLTNSQTARDNTPSIGAAPTSGLNVGGQRARANLVNVDGVDATDNSVNGIRSTVSQDAVQEFQIITNGYAAEYGRASGGVVNIITRSGTNDLHGSAFGYLRNRDFQAVNPFSTTPDPAYTRVQAGAAIGGALKKDKTYYFLSYETTRRQETGFSNIGQNGYNLSPVDVSAQVNAYVNSLGILGNYCGNFGGCTALATDAQAAVFARPADPVIGKYALMVGAAGGTAISGAMPLWAVGGNPALQSNFFLSCNPQNSLCMGLPASFHALSLQAGNYPISEGTTLVGARLDHKLTPNNNLMLRANVSPSTTSGVPTQGQGQNFGQDAYSRTAYSQYRDLAITAQDTATLGTTKINEFRFQYARRGLLFDFAHDPNNFGADVASNIVGFAYVGHEPFSFVRRVETRYQFVDNLSITKGRHNFKFGADINHLPLIADFTVNFGGVYEFGGVGATTLGFPATYGLPEINPVQAYGLGFPTDLIQGLGNPHAEFSNTPLGFFVQDSWRIRPNLTLNYGVRYDIELMPGPTTLTPAGQAGYDVLGITTAVPRDTNNIAPRIGLAWDPKGNGKTVVRASYGMFYDHPLLALQFLAQATDASATPQVLLFYGAPCSSSGPGTSPLNAVNTFQGTLGAATCMGAAANAFAYLPQEQRFDPNVNSLFINQGFLNPPAGLPSPFPLGFLPFGFPNTKNFQFAYSNQANLSIEHEFGHDLALSVAYNFNGGHHINRPINANAVRGDFLVSNWERAVVAALSAGLVPNVDPNFPSSPLQAGVEDFTTPGLKVYKPCGVVNGGQVYAPAPLVNFFRPSGLNPSMTTAYAACVPAAGALLDTLFPGLVNGTPPGAPGGVPFSDMAANYANGSSVYHGLTVNLRKRFSKKYEFLASYTWAHTIDDSTDLESPLSPQDAYFPSAERSNSLFDQRHRFVFSGVYQTGKLSGGSFASKLFSDWTFAPIVEIGSGRPFFIITADPVNFQFAPNSARPNIVAPNAATNPICGNTPVPSSFSPLGAFQVPCPVDEDVTNALGAVALGVLTPQQAAALIDGVGPSLQQLDGNLGRNAGIKPYTLFTDFRVSKRIHFTERVGLDAVVDMFNIINKNNTADVNTLYTNAGQPTAAYDPRQFQFGLRLTF